MAIQLGSGKHLQHPKQWVNFLFRICYGIWWSFFFFFFLLQGLQWRHLWHFPDQMTFFRRRLINSSIVTNHESSPAGREAVLFRQACRQPRRS